MKHGGGFNIFVRMNIFDPSRNEETVANLFRLLAQPSRLQILAVIGRGEACVCHLEAATGLRQANISQQLMLLRDAGLVTTYRDGRNVYYRLANPAVLDLVCQAAFFLNARDWVEALSRPAPLAKCPCPHCAVAAGMEVEQAGEIYCDGASAIEHSRKAAAKAKSEEPH